VKIEINLDQKNIGYILKLAVAGCAELLDYPDICKIVDKKNGSNNLYINHSDFDNWSGCSTWEKGCSIAHALALGGCSKILDYPQYLKIPNQSETTPLHFLTEKLLKTDTAILNKILKIKNLEKWVNSTGITPLHHIARLGYTDLLDYPGIERVESPKYNAHGTPMTLLYRYADSNLKKLLKHSHLMVEYINHGTPLEALTFNNKIKPTVKTLKKYGFKMEKNWHPSKKLDRSVVNTILSVSQAIRFIHY